MSELAKLINIGDVLANKLLEAGIDSIDFLHALGSKEAFLLIRSIYDGACINHLYALEGAIQGIRWHNLSPETKQDLKEFFQSI